MIAALGRIDGIVSLSRPMWAWLGQLAVIVLGVHLAADRLDDPLHGFLVALPVPWTTPEQPIAVAAWLAIALELVVVARAAAALLLTSHEPAVSWASYKRVLSIDAVVLPLFWAPVSLAGAWVVGMAIEDLLAPWHAVGATVLAYGVALLVAWRLGWSGLVRVVGALEVPKRRTAGWLWAPPLLLVAAVAFRNGLPVWGWL